MKKLNIFDTSGHPDSSVTREDKPLLEGTQPTIPTQRNDTQKQPSLVGSIENLDNKLQSPLKMRNSTQGNLADLFVKPVQPFYAPQDPPEVQHASYLTSHMQRLQLSIQQVNQDTFEDLGYRAEIVDLEETVMVMYVAAICMHKEQIFAHLLAKNNFFKSKPQWHVLFSQPGVFEKVQRYPNCSAERNQFDLIVLQAALDRDLFFMTDLVLERSIMTPALLNMLLSDNQKKTLLSLISRPLRPLYHAPELQGKHRTLEKKKSFSKMERELTFYDIVESAVELGAQSKNIIELLQLMQLEVDRSTGTALADLKVQLNYFDLFSLFVFQRKVSLLRYLFTLPSAIFAFDNSLFLRALELEAYDMASLLMKEFFKNIREMTPRELEQSLTSVLSSFNKNNGLVDFKCFLTRSFVESMNLRHACQLLTNIELKVGITNKVNILVLNLNVVKTSCLLIEVLQLVGTKFFQLQVRCHTIRAKIVHLTKKFLAKVDHEAEMKYLLLEKDFEHRDSLDLITRYYIEDFLQTQFADNVVKEIWRSPYATHDSIFSASTNHMLTWNYWHCIKDVEQEQSFLKIKDVHKIEAHPMQFMVWRYSPKARLFVEFIVTVTFAIVIQVMTGRILEMIPQVTRMMDILNEKEADLNKVVDMTSTLYVSKENDINNYYSAMESWVVQFFQLITRFTYVGFLVLFFALGHIPEIVYTSVTKRYFNAYSFKNLWDFAIFTFFFSFILLSYSKNLDGSWKEKPVVGTQTRALIYLRNFTAGNVQWQQALIIFCCVSLWIRVFYLTRFNEHVGKLTSILQKVIIDMILYFIFFLIVIAFFSAVAETAFRNLVSYNTFGSAYQTLFYAAFGYINFDEMLACEFGPNFGILFLSVFLIINIGLFMNLFISILITLYAQYVEKHNIYQMVETLKIRPVMEAHTEFSALVSLYTPLNLLHLFLAPFLLTSSNPELWNKIILWIAYIPILIVTSVLFIVYSLVLMPFTFVKMFFHKMIMIFIYSKSYRVSKADKFMNWILFAIIGPVRILSNVFTDYIAFLKHCLLTDLKKTKISISEKPMSKPTLKTIEKYLQARNERIMPFKQVSSETRDLLGIFNLIACIWQPQKLMSFLQGNATLAPIMKSNGAATASYSRTGSRELGPLFYHIKEYSTLKEIYEGNHEMIVTPQFGRVKAMDLKVLSIMFQDALRQQAVAKVKDDNYIFIRRAITAKTRAGIDKRNKQRARMGLEVGQYVDFLATNVDFETKYLSEKRTKQCVRKLSHMNTTRMLKILDYHPSESEMKRLIYAVNQFGSQYVKSATLKLDPEFPLKTMNSEFLEAYIQQLNANAPKLDSELLKMQHEIHNLVENVATLTKNQKGFAVKEDRYHQQIEGLALQLKSLKQKNEPTTNVKTSFSFIDNYFGRGQQNGAVSVSTTKPKVLAKASFASDQMVGSAGKVKLSDLRKKNQVNN